MRRPVPLRTRILSRFLPLYGILVCIMVFYLFLGSRNLGTWFLTQIQDRTRVSVSSLLDSYVRTIGILQSQYQMIAKTTLDGLQRIFVADTSAMDIPRLELQFFVRRLEEQLYSYEEQNSEKPKNHFFYPFALDFQGKIGESFLLEGLPSIPPLEGRKLLGAYPGEVVVLPLFWSPVHKKFYEYGYWVFPDRSVLGVAIEVNPELLAQSERMVEELKNLPFVTNVNLYSMKTGEPMWQNQKATSLQETLLNKIKENALQKKFDYTQKTGHAKERLYSIWQTPEKVSTMPQKERSVVVEICMDFSNLLNLLYAGVGIGFLLLLGGTAWLIYNTSRTSLEIVSPFHHLIHSMQTFMEDPTAFIPSPDENPLENSQAPVEVQELNKTFWNMGREVAAGMEELKAMNEELEELYMSREKLAGRLEHVISLAASLSSAKEMGEAQYLRRILRLVMEMLPGTESGIVGVLDGDRVKIAFGIGVSLKKLENLALKAENINHKGGAISMASMLSQWPEELQEQFVQICPKIAKGLAVNLHAGGRLLGFIAISQAKGERQDHRFPSDSGRIFDALGSLASGFLGMQQLFAVRGRFQEDLLRSIVSILDLHDPYTSGHSESVAILSFKLAQTLGLAPDLTDQTYLAGLVHDIGKLLIPVHVLNKPGPLTPEEMELIQSHPVKGREVLSHSDELRDIAKVVEHHHERWDGKGYPDGLMGYEIPLISRILCVADAYDAMTSDRSYRKGMSREKARQELRRNGGTQFDPQVVEAFLSIDPEELSSWWEEHDSFWG